VAVLVLNKQLLLELYKKCTCDGAKILHSLPGTKRMLPSSESIGNYDSVNRATHGG